MQRTILFLGKRIDNGELVEGWYYPQYDDLSIAYILSSKDSIVYDVIPDSICQFTGLTDKNGKMIFEGDTVIHRFKRCWKTDYHTSTVIWSNEFLCYYLFDGVSNHRMRDDIEYEIIDK